MKVRKWARCEYPNLDSYSFHNFFKACSLTPSRSGWKKNSPKNEVCHFSLPSVRLKLLLANWIAFNKESMLIEQFLKTKGWDWKVMFSCLTYTFPCNYTREGVILVHYIPISYYEDCFFSCYSDCLKKKKKVSETNRSIKFLSFPCDLTMYNFAIYVTK